MDVTQMRLIACLLALVIALPAAAQDSSLDIETEAQQPQIERPAEPVVSGQRQTTEEAARKAGITPMGRVGGRIENRVQSRINNRLDRNSLPTANTSARFSAAGKQLPPSKSSALR